MLVCLAALSIVVGMLWNKGLGLVQNPLPRDALQLFFWNPGVRDQHRILFTKLITLPDLFNTGLSLSPLSHAFCKLFWAFKIQIQRKCMEIQRNSARRDAFWIFLARLKTEHCIFRESCQLLRFCCFASPVAKCKSSLVFQVKIGRKVKDNGPLWS